MIELDEYGQPKDRALFASRIQQSGLDELIGLCKEITKRLDYLVVGFFGSEAWLHSSFGTKVEKAVDYNERGVSEIYIISEDHWAEQIACAFE